MKITKSAMDAAVAEGILSQDQSSRLLAFLQARPEVGPSFSLTHVLYYLGGLVAIGAMTLFMGLGWEAFGGWGIVCISFLYAAGGLLLANRFQKQGYAIPAGICATFAVFLTPLFIYGLQQGLGVWPEGSLLFPIALTAIGLAIIYLGVLWQKNEQSLTVKVRSVLPVALRELLDSK